MDPLSSIISLLSKTEGRDKTLRLIQYATLNSKAEKGIFASVYDQIRMTRKILRFLRTLQYITKIRKQIPELKKFTQNRIGLISKVFAILEDVFAFLFFLSDHRVCLSQLGTINKKHREVHYPKSMKFYMFQNVFGVIKNLFEILGTLNAEMQIENKFQNEEQILFKIKGKLFDLIKCLLDIFVALFYLKGTISAKNASVIGVITSLIAISQSMKLI